MLLLKPEIRPCRSVFRMLLGVCLYLYSQVGDAVMTYEESVGVSAKNGRSGNPKTAKTNTRRTSKLLHLQPVLYKKIIVKKLEVRNKVTKTRKKKITNHLENL